MKKKFLSFALMVSLVASLTGCGLRDLRAEGGNANSTIDIQSGVGSGNSYNSNLLDDDRVSDKIDEIEGYIDMLFYFDVDPEKQEEALYDGILEGLDDPYSVYYTPEEYAELTEETSGEYCGVGAVVTQDKDMIVSVVRPVPGSPAEKAGVEAGDIILEVDGVEIVDQELSLVVEMIRGEKGTIAHIRVYRESIGDYIEFEIERDVVENITVTASMLENNIGYIQVTQFYENTSDEFIAEVKKFEEQGVAGIIVDLRDNPGGVLGAVVEMCDYIIGEGNIVTTKDRDGKVIRSYDATSGHKFELPMVVLVNGNSASASEIFAGAMKDTGKAVLVGTTTYGKGIVQSVIPLSDGAAIKLTVAKYFTPSGNDIHEIGIAPDYEILPSDGIESAVNLSYEDDLPLQKAEEVILEMSQDK